MKIITKFSIGIGVLITLSPLGLLLPEHFKAGSAWGEWGADEIRELAGYLPKGLEKLSRFWNAPLPDYAFKGWTKGSNLSSGFVYILSAVIGVLVCIGIVLILGKFLSKK